MTNFCTVQILSCLALGSITKTHDLQKFQKKFKWDLEHFWSSHEQPMQEAFCLHAFPVLNGVSLLSISSALMVLSACSCCEPCTHMLLWIREHTGHRWIGSVYSFSSWTQVSLSTFPILRPLMDGTISYLYDFPGTTVWQCAIMSNQHQPQSRRQSTVT